LIPKIRPELTVIQAIRITHMLEMDITDKRESLEKLAAGRAALTLMGAENIDTSSEVMLSHAIEEMERARDAIVTVLYPSAGARA
jgi:hypothetical protein